MCGSAVTCQKPIDSPQPPGTKDRQVMGKLGDKIMAALLATFAVAALARPQVTIKPFVAEEEYWNDERQLSDNTTQLPESNITLPNRVTKSDVATYKSTTEMAITLPDITEEAPSMRTTSEFVFQTYPFQIASTSPPPSSTGFTKD